jgi:hypothetical protein
LIQRIVVDIAIETGGPNVSEVRVAGDDQRAAEAVPRGEIEKRRVIIGDVGLGVDTRVVARQEALFLKGVAAQRVFGERGGQSQCRLVAAPAEFAESLANIGG